MLVFFGILMKRSKVQSSFTGIDIGPSIIELAEDNLERFDFEYKLINKDFFEINDELGEKFDLIICQPSFYSIKRCFIGGWF